MSEKCILIVDDDKDNIIILQEILSRHYAVESTDNGKDGLILAKANPSAIDLILLDVMMPGIDGYEVCRHLKEDPQTKGIPIIFLTARNDIEGEKKGLELGAVDYITKPVSPPIVLARLRTHLSLQHALQTLEENNKELREAAQLHEEIERISRHDLKNPLSSIIGWPDLIAEMDNITPDQKVMLTKIKVAGLHILQMINSSLDLFKIEQGTYKFAPKKLDVWVLLKKIVEEMAAKAKNKKLTFHIYPKDKKDVFLINGEEWLCYTLFGNLIQNAIEASPREKKISISLEKKDLLSINIQNVGAVPESIRTTFFQKYVTSGKERSGTGLGTYSAKLFAELHGGSIDLDASKEDATTITVTLPY